MDVPTAAKLQDIYTADVLDTQSERWNKLLCAFKDTYKRPAEHVARSPGRVNIIGEHIDYSLYDVLPMAVSADVIIAFAVSPESGNFEVANVKEEKYPRRRFQIGKDGDIEIDATTLEWSNYFKAGLKASTQLLRQKDKTRAPVGMQIMVDGTVPAGGGLSSSAAFVCASALAVLAANGEERIDKTELCELAIVSERAVGVNSGGMDQAASVFSLKDSATYVSFLPSLEASPVEFPKTETEYSFVIAQSFVTADKHTSGPVGYNLRVVECTLAAAVLSKIFALTTPLPSDSSPLSMSLRGFQSVYFKEKADLENKSDFAEQLARLVTLVEDYLPQEEGYTREQISFFLDVSIEELNKHYMTKFPVEAERFMLRQRALHVFKEAQRVLRFRELLSSPAEDGSALLKELGSLMNATQDSCRDTYECSCPELDELCQIARQAGASGSRLTGAGWGGCSVHLVASDKIEAVKTAWTDKYYKRKWPDIDDSRLHEAIVVSRPGSGSFLYKVTGDNIT